MVGDPNPNPDFNCTWIGAWRNQRNPLDTTHRNTNTNLMRMTHVPEIDAEYRHQKTGIINWHKNRALSYLLPKTSTRKIWYQIACQMLQKPLPVFGADFWYVYHWRNAHDTHSRNQHWKPVPVSGTSDMQFGTKFFRYRTLPVFHNKYDNAVFSCQFIVPVFWCQPCSNGIKCYVLFIVILCQFLMWY